MVEYMSKQEASDSAKSWHWHFLESVEAIFLSESVLRRKCNLLNSNRKRLYLPDRPGIRRKEILSNPDVILLSKRTGNFDYILEVEYQVNYKKIAGIAVLTDIAVRQMSLKPKPKLILVTKKEFPNRELLQKDVSDVVRNIEFEISTSDKLISEFSSLIM